MHIPALRRLTALAVAAATVTAAHSASASHYYAVHAAGVFDGSADDGDFTAIWTSILHATCNIFQHDFTNHEMWYGLDGGDNYWIELGFKDGSNSSGGCEDGTNFFWADNRNGGGYNEHNTSWVVPWNSWQSLQISAAGSCTWNVMWTDPSSGNFTITGTSTSNCPGSGRTLIAGIESTNPGAGSAQGWLSDWWEENGSGGWSQGWPNDFTCQTSVSLNDCGNISNPQIIWTIFESETEETLNEPF